MTKRFRIGLLLVAAAGLALTAAGCGGGSKKSSSGGGGGNGVTALPASSCSPVQYQGSGKADYLIASDLPLQGSSAGQTETMVNAIKLYLEQIGGKAGDFTVSYAASADTPTMSSGAATASAPLYYWTGSTCAASPPR